MVDLAERLAQSGNASIVAPAGCGKTVLIARAVKVSTGKQLVLTHTHAGVNALRKHMLQQRVPSERYVIETIDGWCLKLASSFPTMSQISYSQPSAGEWLKVHEAASSLLESVNIRTILAASYNGAYVDEYQDCTKDQHALICQLAQQLPVRVLGDPLQGVFSFGQNVIVQWDRDVFDIFPQLDTLETHYRWLNTNPVLGEWLVELRRRICEDREVDLSQAPITWRHGDARQCQYGCNKCTLCQCHQSHEYVVLLKKWNPACREVARYTGRYQAIEEMECKRLMEFTSNLATQLDGKRGYKEITRFVSLCYTNADAIFNNPEVDSALMRVTKVGEMSQVLALLDVVEACGVGRRFCSDLWYEAKRALRLFTETPGKFASLRDAAWAAREQTRRIGRRFPSRLASTVLLVKGLEFDHAVIADADSIRIDRESHDPWLGAKSFYVAVTRASRSLTIFSSSPIIQKWRA